MEIEFPYFLKKVRNGASRNLGHYKCSMHGSLQKEDELTLSVEVPISLPIAEKIPTDCLVPWGDGEKLT